MKKKLSDIQKIRSLLQTEPRNALLLEILLHTKATVQDILSLKVVDLKKLKQGDLIPLDSEQESGTGYYFSTSMHDLLGIILNKFSPEDDDLLFKSSKGGEALSRTSVSRLVRKWIKESGLQCNGIRELRSMARSSPEVNFEKSGAERVPVNSYGFSKIQTLSRQEAVFQELEKAIISGKILPGQKLVTDKIARQMGVSRIPVREAMVRLAERGFVTTRPKWGNVVNELSRANLKEILELRLMLECEAISKAAILISDATIKKLMKINKEFTEARQQNKADELLEANRRFHTLAYRDSNAPVLLDLINQLWDRVSPYYNIMFRQSVTTHPIVGANYHDQLIKAMQMRNAEEAKHWIRTDLVQSAKFVLELFDLHQQDLNH